LSPILGPGVEDERQRETEWTDRVRDGMRGRTGFGTGCGDGQGSGRDAGTDRGRDRRGD